MTRPVLRFSVQLINLNSYVTFTMFAFVKFKYALKYLVDLKFQRLFCARVEGTVVLL